MSITFYNYWLEMVEIVLKVGPKGQIVIPKSIRESLGIIENKTVILSISEKNVQIKAPAKLDLVQEWETQARKMNVNVSKDWVYGDALYKEEFS